MNNRKEYLKWLKHRRQKRVWTSILCGVLLAGVGLGVGYAIWHGQKSNVAAPTSIQIVTLHEPQHEQDGAPLKEKGDEVVLQAVTADHKQAINVAWSGLKTISGIKYNETHPSILIITAIHDLLLIDQLDIYATNGNYQTHHIIAIGGIEWNKVPLTSQYFTFSTKDKANDTIDGFSQNVIDNPSILDHFNTLDFSNQTDVEYISGECQFNRPITEAIDQYVFDSWQVEKIDLGSLTFLNNSSGRSGDHTFSLTQTVPKLGIEPIPSPPDINWTNLSSLITLDFGTSVWVTNGTKESAYNTFSYTSLSALSTLNLNHAIFASSIMDDNASIFTADNTFAGADLSNLKSLDLSNIMFAVSNLSDRCGYYTAFYTFEGANLSALIALNLNSTNFWTNSTQVATNATVSSGSYTFANAILSSLTTLDLSQTVFASNDISQPADVSIGDHTFFQVDWTSLATLQLPLTFAFSISLAYENVIKIASSTFAWELPNRFNAMPNLTDLYLSTSNPTDDDYVWNDTFNNVDNNEQIQIHGYTNRPNWFNTSWFPNATWSVN